MIDIYIPTYKRSHKIKDIVDQISQVTMNDYRLVFIVERDDMDSYGEAIGHGLITIINHRTQNYAGAINSAWDCLQSEMLFAGADDLKFYPNWDIEALKRMTGDIRVVGTNDLHNQEVERGEHATHYLIDGGYIKEVGGTIDNSAPILFEGYSHNWTDREAIGTAKFRGVFTPCTESVVEHLHFTFGLSQLDETYEKTRVGIAADEKLYESRRDMWGRL